MSLLLVIGGRGTVGKCHFDQNGLNDHFGQNDTFRQHRILAFARLKWTKMVHFSPFWPEGVHLGPPTVLCMAIPDLSAPRSQRYSCECECKF